MPWYWPKAVENPNDAQVVVMREWKNEVEEEWSYGQRRVKGTCTKRRRGTMC